MYVLLSRIQARPGRTVKQEQEEISRNHKQTFICLSVEKEELIECRVPREQFLLLLILLFPVAVELV